MLAKFIITSRSFISLILETSRLRLKPILESEIDIFHRILVDPYVRRYLCDARVLPMQQASEMLQESQKLFQEEKLGL